MKKILLIDDDPNEHKLFKFYIQKIFGPDCHLQNARTLEDGIAALAQNRFDALFLDNRLKPFADFRQTLPEMIDLLENTPTYVISASVDDDCFDDIERYPVAGVLDKFLVKARLESGLLG